MNLEAEPSVGCGEERLKKKKSDIFARMESNTGLTLRRSREGLTG